MAKKRKPRVPHKGVRPEGSKAWEAGGMSLPRARREVGDTGPIQEVPEPPPFQSEEELLAERERAFDAMIPNPAMPAAVSHDEIDARRTGKERIVPDSPGIQVQRPVKSLDMHMDLLRWLTTDGAKAMRRRWWDLYFASESKKQSIRDEGLMSEDEIEEQMDAAADIQTIDEKDMLNRAMTFHVTTGMSQLVTAIAQHADERPLRSTDLWAPAGFAVLPDEAKIPYFTPDGENSSLASMPVKVIAWRWGEVGAYKPNPTEENPNHMEMFITQGVRIFVYASIEDMRTAWGMSNVTPQQLSHLPLIDMTSWAVDMEWETLSFEDTEDYHERTVAHHLGDKVTVEEDEDRILVKGKSEGVYYNREKLTVATSSHVGLLRRWLLAFWNILDEEVAMVKPERVDRPAQKRAQRMGRTPGDGDVVRVVRLRKIIDIDSREELDVPEIAHRFTHRWRVRSHWRHLIRGLGLLDGNELLVDANWNWIPHDERPVSLRLTDEDGNRERVQVASAEGGIITLAWTPRLKQGYVEVERMAWVKEHSAGAQGGFLVERYDVVSVER